MKLQGKNHQLHKKGKQLEKRKDSLKIQVKAMKKKLHETGMIA